MKEYCYYYEYYPHFLGTMRRKGKFDISKMDRLVERYDNGDEHDRNEVEDELHTMFDAFAFGDVFAQWQDVRTALETKGLWVSMWEEGSHAISMTSFADAKQAVGLLEIGEW